MTCALTYPLVQWETQSHVVLVENNYALDWFYLWKWLLCISSLEKKENKSTLVQDLG